MTAPSNFNPISDEELFHLLKDNQYLTEEQLSRARLSAQEQNISLTKSLLQLDLIDDENLGRLIADHLKVPFVSLTKVSIPAELLHIIPETVAEKQKAVVFEQTTDYLKLATCLPQNKNFFDLVAKKSGQPVKVYFATIQDIEDSLTLYKKELQKRFDEMLQEQVKVAGQSIKNELSVTRIVDLLLEYAFQNKASDIHIEPTEKETLVRFRIDGVLHDVLRFPFTLHDQVVTRIKVLAKLRTDEHLSAQDGKLQIKLNKEDLDVRVSVVPVVDGEKVVLRLLSSHNRQFSLADLGMNDKDLTKVTVGFSKPFGMVLSTGPTGSGKTTTMYAILKILNTREKNIATIEDPVEYEIEGINQIQVNEKTNLTFAAGLKSILRQDPDIIFVGEIRDQETASIAINSATTGHLVISTLHTNDAATTLPRLIDMGIEPFLVSSTVNVIIGQRLVRKICEKCKVSYIGKYADIIKQFDESLIKKHLGSGAEIRLYKGKGCPVCHTTGYVGRIGVFEILNVTGTIQQLINQKADSDTITAQAVKEGMTTMMEDGLDKVQRGVTTLEEIMRATKE